MGSGNGSCLEGSPEPRALPLSPTAALLAMTPAAWMRTPDTMTLTNAGGPCVGWTPTASTW